MTRLVLAILCFATTTSILHAEDGNDPLVAKLSKVVSLKDPIEAVFDLALTDLADEHQLAGKLFLNKRAFAAAGIEDVTQAPVKLTKLTDVPLRIVLEKLAQQVNGVVVVRDHLIEITSASAIKSEINLNDSDPEAGYKQSMPLVRHTLKDVPLRQALAELSNNHEMTIILAPQVGDKGDAMVSARLLNVPLDVAVELLADMADLKLVRKANVLYVTTPERAEPLLASEEKRREVIREMEHIQLEKQRLEASKPVAPKN